MSDLTALPEFTLIFKHCGLSLIVTAKVEEPVYLSQPGLALENTERMRDIYCAAIAGSAQQIADQAMQSHRTFLQALGQSVHDDFCSYLKNGNAMSDKG